MWNVIRDVESAVAFLLELAVYAAAAHWGFTCFRRWPLKLVAGLGAPATLILIWGEFGAPTATHPVHGLARAALEMGWYGSGAAALAASRRPRAAVVLIGLYLTTALAAIMMTAL